MRSQRTLTITIVLLLGALPATLEAQRTPELHVRTATRPASLEGPAFNLLTWPRPTSEEGGSPYERCNLYRKIDPRAPYPLAPLNAAPLQRYNDCERIKAVIPEGSEDWKLVQEVLAGGAPRLLTKVTPCSLATGPIDPKTYARLELLARSRWRLAVLLGLGYVDRQVQQGKLYYYELRGVDRGGAEVVLATDIQIRTGLPVNVPPPEDLQAIAGDRRVFVHWRESPTAAGFEVLRAGTPNGPFEALNVASITTSVTEDLDGNDLDLTDGPRYGYVDAQEWDASGNPTVKKIGFFFLPTGPTNGLTYYYQVASLDLLGFAGTPSAPVSVVPEDRTPPAVPAEVTVLPDDAAGKMVVRWVRASRDADGHPEPAVLGYRVYRKESLEDTVGEPVGGFLPQPPYGTAFVSVEDTDPDLRPPYGEKTFWYQVECEDAKGNVSSLSAPVSGHLRDLVTPAPPTGIAAQGFEDRIRVTWSLNSEPDIDGYEIFRSLCDGGEWACASMTPVERSRCTATIAPLGYVSHADALAGGAVFEDTTVPAGSPLCYAYLVKALDKAQNRSGSVPPDPAVEQIVCERLRDTTPPEAAIITGLQARDGAILVEWIAAPVQDVHAYHVYRADAEAGPWVWVGGTTVAIPPALPQALGAPYQAPSLATCDKIPLKANEAFSIGSHLDTSAQPHRVYWYKVLGIDWDGNEATGGVPASSFTFNTQGPAVPTVFSVTAASQPCGLRVAWSPAFDASKHRGFALFRSTSAAGPYLQVGSILTANLYFDDKVAHGVTYHYKVARLDRDGGLSAPSAPKSGTVN